MSDDPEITDEAFERIRLALGVDDWKPSLGLSGEEAKQAEGWIGSSNLRHLASGRRDRPKRIAPVRIVFEYYRTPEDRWTNARWRLNRVVNGRPEFHGEYEFDDDLVAEIRQLRSKGQTVNACTKHLDIPGRKEGGRKKSFQERFGGFGQ